MMKKNYRAKFLMIAVLGLALLLANGNVLRSNWVARGQGIDLAGMDKAVDPGDDFFSYANGGWFKAVQIPSDRPAYGAFDIIAEKVRTRTADLIKGAGKSNDPEAKKIGDYYDAFMDEDAIEKHGLTPIKAELDEIN